MRSSHALVFLLGVLVSACGQRQNTQPPPPPPNTFTLTCPQNIAVPLGGEAKLTVQVQVTSGDVDRVRLFFSYNSAGLTSSPTERTIDMVNGRGAQEFTIRSSVGADRSEPFFYFYGIGQGSGTQRQQSCAIRALL